MKIGVLLSGCGVYDGVEIQEAVLTLLAIEQRGWEAVCIGIDQPQYHVINHLNGEVMADEKRNMMIEAARISRGKIQNISQVFPVDIDALVIPGGFGSAKNFTTWAFDGPDGTILPEVKLLIVNMMNVGKPIVALCVSPVVVAKALEDASQHPNLSIGTSETPSPYDISSFSEGLQKTGAKVVQKGIQEIQIDTENKIICAPCYMMDASLLEVHANIQQAMDALNSLL
jgi:enhancing lycopene biosynthesis protein 2